MSMQSGSHPLLSRTDGLASGSADLLILIGRVLMGVLFLWAGWAKFGGIPGTVTYFTNLKMPAPEMWAWISAFAEMIIGAAFILGIATRYTALISFVYVLIATLIAHRYWEYTGAAQFANFNHFLKNLAIMGGSLALFVTGAGRFSADSKLSK